MLFRSTGGTSLLDENGRTFASIPKYTNQVLVGEMQTRHGVTPASKYGSTLELIFIVAWLFFLYKSRRTFRR